MRLQKIIVETDQIIELSQIRKVSNLELLVKKNVSLIILDDLQLLKKINANIILEENSLLEYFFYGNIKELCKYVLKVILKGKNSQAKIRGGLIVANEFCIDIKQEHLSDYTKSDLLLKTGLLENSKLSFKGIAFVDENCKEVVVNQYNKNMILGKNTEIISRPSLEILSKNAHCEHGSASSALDKEDVFYMYARGLNKLEINKLLIQGFLKESLPKDKNFLGIKL